MESERLRTAEREFGGKKIKRIKKELKKKVKKNFLFTDS